MLVSFSVANFRSFGAEATLSLVASKAFSQHPSHIAPIPDTEETVLRTAVLYGANAAGKSNLFKALAYLKRIVEEPNEKGSGMRRTTFSLNSHSAEPTSFDIQFVARDKLYRYGVKLADERVLEEWLIQVIGNKEKVLFERATQDGELKLELHSQNIGASEKLIALSKIGGPPNQTFLATLIATLESAEYGEHLGAVVEWFDSLILISPRHVFRTLAASMLRDEGLRNFASEFLKASSTGIENLRVQKIPITAQDLAPYFNNEDAQELLQYVKDEKTFMLPFDGGSEIVSEGSDEDKFFRLSVQTDHNNSKGRSVSFKLSDESDGTRRLLDLLPALYDLQTNESVYFIDEIDRSLHPILVRGFLEFFLKSCCESRRQIILTTHESNLLDLDILRRDEIWFAEKDQLGSTQLYSLADFKIRNDLSVRKHYLQGRFGAIPFLGSLDRLIHEGERCATNSAKAEALNSESVRQQG